jgi:tape measure domain-containing protein
MALNSQTLRFIVDLKDKTGPGLKKAEAGLRRLKKLALSLPAALGGLSASLIAKSLFDVGAEVEALNRAFVSIEGSAAGAKSSLAFLREEADRLGLEFYESADAFKSISAAAKQTALEGQPVRDIFVGIGEAASALGLSTEQTTGALRALEQMISKGNVQAEELRGQLGERLPGAFQLAARAMGVTTQELNKMLDNGEVLASDLLPKLAKALHEQYGQAALDAADDARQASNRFKTAWKDMQVVVADSGFMDAATDAIKRLTASLKDPETKKSISELSSGLVSLAEGGLKSIISIHDKLPEDAVGAAGVGIIGRILFGGKVGLVMSLLVLVNGQMKKLDASVGDMGKSLEEAGKNFGKFWEGIGGREFTQNMIKAYTELWDTITGQKHTGASTNISAIGSEFDAINTEIENYTQKTGASMAEVNKMLNDHYRNVVVKAQETNKEVDESLKVLTALHKKQLAEVDKLLADGIISVEEAESKKREITLEYLSIIVEDTKKAYEEINKAGADPEKIAEAKAAMIDAETEYLNKVLELNKDAADRKIEVEKDAQARLEQLREAQLDLRAAQYRKELQEIETAFRDERISYEEMVKQKLEAEVEFLEYKLEKVVEATKEAIETYDTESAAYVDATAKRLEAMLDLEEAQAKLNTVVEEGVAALEKETDAIEKSSEVLDENADARDRAAKSGTTYIKNIEGEKVAVEGATEAELERLQVLSDYIATYERAIQQNKASINVLSVFRRAIEAVKDEYQTLVNTIKANPIEAGGEGGGEEGPLLGIGRAAGGPIGANTGRFIRRPHGPMPGVDTGRDYVPVLARGGEWFIRNEASDFWSKNFGGGFMRAINAPWSGLGKKITGALKAGLAVRKSTGGPISMPSLSIPTPVLSMAGGGNVAASRVTAGAVLGIRDLGKVDIEIGGKAYPVAGEANTLQQLNRAVERSRKMTGRRG